jgi:O-antigen/teichoic acid export membrane protein
MGALMGGEAQNHGSSTSALRRWAKKIESIATRQVSNPLSRGGLALVVNTALTGVLGFVYWIVAAHLFSPNAVGVAGALVAATTLFSGIGQLNLSGMLMRFLPGLGGKSRRLVLTTYVFAASVSALLAAISLGVIRTIAASASPLHLDSAESAALVLAVAAMAIFTIQDSALIGLRRAFWVPAENGAFGLAKIITLFILAPVGTAFALYGAWMIPLALTIPIITAMLFYKFLPLASRPGRASHLGPEVRSNIIRFAIGDAAGGLFTQAWMYLLPVIITLSLGGSVNALFYISFLFSSTIDQVAINYASSLTVEGARSPGDTATLIRQALRHILAIIVPLVAVIALMSPFLLRAFGESYVRAVPLLIILLATCFPKAISTVYYSYCRIQRTTYKSALLQAYVCVASLSAVVLFSHPFGLTGIGFSIMAVQFSAALVAWWALRRVFKTGRGINRQGRHRHRGNITRRSEGFKLAVTRR